MLLMKRLPSFNECVDQRTGLRNLHRVSNHAETGEKGAWWTDLNQEANDNEFMNLEAVPDGDLEVATHADAEDQIIGSDTDLSDMDAVSDTVEYA